MFGDLPVPDELGYLPFNQIGVARLLHPLSKLQERGSSIVITNLSFTELVSVFGDAKLTTVRLAGCSRNMMR